MYQLPSPTVDSSVTPLVFFSSTDALLCQWIVPHDVVLLSRTRSSLLELRIILLFLPP